VINNPKTDGKHNVFYRTEKSDNYPQEKESVHAIFVQTVLSYDTGV